MKRTVLILTALTIFLFGCSKENSNNFFGTSDVVGGSILVEYTHSIGKENETRHTFSEQGTKFDKVFDANGNVLKEFIYLGNNIIEIIATVEEGSDHYFYQYNGDQLVNITIDRTRNGVITTESNDYVYEGNHITLYSPTDPPNLFKKRYTLNAEGEIYEIEFFDFRSNTYYDWHKRRYGNYTNGEPWSYEEVNGSYDAYNDFYDGIWEQGGYWNYFDTVKNPLKESLNRVYLVALLTPEVFFDGLYGESFLGSVGDQFVQEATQYYASVFTDYHLIRNQNIVIQTNNLPKSGNVLFGFRPFIFTYTE
ncbi:MAG: hypothetical protein AAF489_03050 [Bacteroidota bacterium]